jgi:hypothetical protein
VHPGLLVVISSLGTHKKCQQRFDWKSSLDGDVG